MITKDVYIFIYELNQLNFKCIDLDITNIILKVQHEDKEEEEKKERRNIFLKFSLSCSKLKKFRQHLTLNRKKENIVFDSFVLQILPLIQKKNNMNNNILNKRKKTVNYYYYYFL